MPKSLIYSATPVFLATTVVWIFGVSNHKFLANEIWLYVGIFLLPATAVCTCSWLIFVIRSGGESLDSFVCFQAVASGCYCYYLFTTDSESTEKVSPLNCAGEQLPWKLSATKSMIRKSEIKFA